jgi:conjugal transfer/entry exclusion protein
MNDPAKMIEVFQALLAQLEQTISVLPQLVEDGRADSLGNQIQSYQTKLARVKNVLRKHQDHERRKREIEKSNRDNSRKW